MGSCIICGRDVDGRICESHQEDVVFEFRGNDPNQLVPGRFYRGVVDGYADFGVFVDLSSNVTGLLHRSELDRRLESLDWEPGDDVFVQVKDVRDNGNVDLTWSIRQSEREFRGLLVQEGSTEELPDEPEEESRAESGTGGGDGGLGGRGGESTSTSTSGGESATGGKSGQSAEESGGPAHPGASAEAEAVAPEPESLEGQHPARSGGGSTGDGSTGGGSADGGSADGGSTRGATTTRRDRGTTAAEAEPTGDIERVEIRSLSDRVGETVRVEGEVVGARQTGGPTVFELRDETGVVDCAAFVEAGVRAYPEVEVGNVVRLEGEVEVRRNEIQVETDALAVLEAEERETVERRLAEALTAEARPDEVAQLAGHDAVAAVSEPLLDAAEAVRRAVLESRPIVVRHAATADGYVAGAALERAVLPLVRTEHSKSDAEYHYFTRRPLDEAVYGMDAATNDVTRMLQDRDRHDEKLPLVVLVGTGSTIESEDGLGLLGIYGARRVVVDAAAADPEVAEVSEVLVNPDLADTDVNGDGLTTGALVATLAATVNGDVRDDVAHLPAVSYWTDAPAAYVDLAEEAGYDAETVGQLREAVALEAYYQSYEDKRELIADLLFGDGEPAPEGADAATLAGHIAGQFREKLETEVETAEANLEVSETGGVEFAILDAEAFTHRFDFPPTTLLVDELHRRHADGEPHVTLGVAMDELWVRSTADLDVRAVADEAADLAPEAGITAEGVREGRIEFLSGAREDVEDAVVAAVTEQIF